MATTARVAGKDEQPRIRDFVCPTLLAEEEVVLEGGVTLKFNAKTRLDKVSSAMWLVANTRTPKTLMKADTNFNVLQYLATPS